jgi:hypothetical protein
MLKYSCGVYYHKSTLQNLLIHPRLIRLCRFFQLLNYLFLSAEVLFTDQIPVLHERIIVRNGFPLINWARLSTMA